MGARGLVVNSHVCASGQAPDNPEQIRSVNTKQSESGSETGDTIEARAAASEHPRGFRGKAKFEE